MPLMENSGTGRDGGKTEAGGQAGRWMDVRQAAEELGISSDAVRKRVARGTLRSDKREDGSVKVWLDDDQPTGGTWAGHRLDELVEAKEEALRDLRDQLEYMRRESERKDAIIMRMAQANASLTQRIPELEAPPEPRDAVKVSETSGNGTREDTQEPLQRRSWLLRWFGF